MTTPAAAAPVSPVGPSQMRTIGLFLQPILLGVSGYLAWYTWYTDPTYGLFVLVLAAVSLAFYWAARRLGTTTWGQWAWVATWILVPPIAGANIIVIWFGWVLPTVWVYLSLGLALIAVVNHVRLYSVARWNHAVTDCLLHSASAGIAIGTSVLSGLVYMSYVVGLAGNPSPGPRCAFIEEMIRTLEAGNIPVLTDADLSCLRASFDSDAAHLVIQDAPDPHDGALHPQSDSSAFLTIYHHEDSTRMIPGPGGEIRPVRYAYRNSKRSLHRPRWIHWTALGSLGHPGGNLPPDTSYGLLIRLGSTANVSRLIDSLRAHKHDKIRRVWQAWHDGVPHDHLDTYTPLPEDEHAGLSNGDRRPHYAVGELIKLHVPRRGNDYRFNLVRYYHYHGTSNNRDMALWLEHSHSMGCEACEIHGWCSE